MMWRLTVPRATDSKLTGVNQSSPKATGTKAKVTKPQNTVNSFLCGVWSQIGWRKADTEHVCRIGRIKICSGFASLVSYRRRAKARRRTRRSLRLSWRDRNRSSMSLAQKGDLRRCKTSEETSKEQGAPVGCCMWSIFVPAAATFEQANSIYQADGLVALQRQEDEVTRDSDWDSFTLWLQMLGSGWRPPHLEQESWYHSSADTQTWIRHSPPSKRPSDWQHSRSKEKSERERVWTSLFWSQTRNKSAVNADAVSHGKQLSGAWLAEPAPLSRWQRRVTLQTCRRRAELLSFHTEPSPAEAARMWQIWINKSHKGRERLCVGEFACVARWGGGGHPKDHLIVSGYFIHFWNQEIPPNSRLWRFQLVARWLSVESVLCLAWTSWKSDSSTANSNTGNLLLTGL